MTKVCTHGRDGSLAMRMLEQSLRRLETDHLDLSQFHDELYKSTLKFGSDLGSSQQRLFLDHRAFLVSVASRSIAGHVALVKVVQHTACNYMRESGCTLQTF